ncbi:transposase [Flavobacterium sp. ZB4R12]|uniref:transposase n=1 Tax=Flavobacterium sp. ZB4R12 TaxID=3398732 RepID=UPI003AAA3D4B
MVLVTDSHNILFKSRNKWTQTQVQRASLLFELYPSIEKAYELSQSLSYIYENNTDKI